MSNQMGIFDVLYNCRAMRRIKPDPVPEETLVKLIDAANQAASGSNQQNGRWIVVRDRAQKEKLAEMNRRVFEAYTGPSGGRAGSLPHQSEAKRARMLEAVRWQAEHFADIPAIVIACLQVALPLRDSFAAGAGAGGSIWPGVRTCCSPRALLDWQRLRRPSPLPTGPKPAKSWSCPKRSCRSV
ncbi:nitroreductase family protein [Candidatus Amarobacter glycogenicus]|uniref:nitroreductase family protein n=1 Tax=Candidatus Amarobacter glycogenicus TaxID=3140699 RepID=UPI002A11EC12|nr:nitroreductase family protein [Dehalococcoidia bacterium]